MVETLFENFEKEYGATNLKKVKIKEHIELITQAVGNIGM